MSDYTVEKFVKILRHLATQLPAYWVVSYEGAVNSKKLEVDYRSGNGCP